MTSGVMFIAGLLIKSGTCMTVGLVLSEAVRRFHTYEMKAKKKLGGEEHDVHFENLRQRVRESRNVQ